MTQVVTQVVTQAVTQVVTKVQAKVEVTRREWLWGGLILCHKQEEQRPALHAVPAWAQRACPAVIPR